MNNIGKSRLIQSTTEVAILSAVVLVQSASVSLPSSKRQLFNAWIRLYVKLPGQETQHTLLALHGTANADVLHTHLFVPRLS